MQAYYAPDAVLSALVKLDETESAHVVRVMRQKNGDEIHLFDGKGKVYRAVLVSCSPKEVLARVDHLLMEVNHQGPELHIGMALTKQPERWEWFLEKATELGVTAIWPFFSSRSERRQFQEERALRIIRSASKQSMQWNVPEIKKIKSWNELLSDAKDLSLNRYLAVLHPDTKPLAEVYPPGIPAMVLIGPEGDFSHEEMEMALSRGFQPVSLGQSRLRVETAGVYVSAHHRYINQL